MKTIILFCLIFPLKSDQIKQFISPENTHSEKRCGGVGTKIGFLMDGRKPFYFILFHFFNLSNCITRSQASIYIGRCTEKKVFLVIFRLRGR